MSTFNGKLEDTDLDFISIDCFQESTFSSTVFLLTHIHVDHTKGLYRKAFMNMMRESNTKLIYGSCITREIVKFKIAQYDPDGIILSKFVVLDANEQVTVYSPDNKNGTFPVVISSLPAAHCPGSVMFLIEYKNRRILFTGDIRLGINDILQMSPMTNSDRSIKKIHDLYLDTTFATKRFMDFPSREESVKQIISIIKQLRIDDYRCKIHLLLPYHYGLEFVFCKLYEEFRCRIHVHQDKYDNVYSHIEGVTSFVTADCNEHFFIHACLNEKCNFALQNSEVIRCLKPCAMSFENCENTVLFRNGIYKICYSSHCSFNELQEIKNLLNPDKIISLVGGNTMYAEKFHANKLDVLSKKKCDLLVNYSSNKNNKNSEKQKYYEMKKDEQELYRKLDLNL